MNLSKKLKIKYGVSYVDMKHMVTCMREFLLDVFDLIKSASDKSYTHSIPCLAYVLGVFQNERIVKVTNFISFH